jgi:hypothetical protein
MYKVPNSFINLETMKDAILNKKPINVADWEYDLIAKNIAYIPYKRYVATISALRYHLSPKYPFFFQYLNAVGFKIDMDAAFFHNLMKVNELNMFTAADGVKLLSVDSEQEYYRLLLR